MKTFLCFFCAFIIFPQVFGKGKLRFNVDDQYEVCSPETDSYQTFDPTDMNLISVNDTHTYLNGTFRTLINMPPWHARVFTEKLYGEKWEIFMFNRNMPNFCSLWHLPTEVWYDITKKFQNCPFKVGDIVPLDMVRINDFSLNFPKSFKGRWRGTYHGYREIDGRKKMECVRIYADMVEDHNGSLFVLHKSEVSKLICDRNPQEMKILFCTLCVSTLFTTIHGSAKFIIDEQYEVCSPETDSFETFDRSNIEFITVNDTHSFLNGSMTVLHDIPPFHVRLFTEKLYGDKWEKFLFDREIRNFCYEMHQSFEFWYEIMMHFHPCPYSKGDIILADMIRINVFNVRVPRNFHGRWRGTYHGFRQLDGKKKMECYRIYAEFVDE
ncbi:CLUMA_CG010519, isoform A [Clunio marinus]|uniref:CLUMA_CG010519, isoform A n=1 Tax=Clunio marinus TaxID=568069 RepID=A0A1J1IBK4_9DIPT|nr:CLUMA_CG010519, isoform A [Clunio marinus]